MLVQHFTMKTRRVADPMRPGRTAAVGYLSASGNSSHSYIDPHTEEEVTVSPDRNGWLDVPHEVGIEVCRFRNKGSGFYTPEEIDDTVRLGQFEGDAPPADKQPAARSSARGNAARANARNEPGEV